jgi:hypothetical protein
MVTLDKFSLSLIGILIALIMSIVGIVYGITMHVIFGHAFDLYLTIGSGVTFLISLGCLKKFLDWEN